jgi:hypothetical protein
VSLPLIQQALTLVFDLMSCCGIALVIAAYIDVVERRSQRSYYDCPIPVLPPVAPGKLPDTKIIVIEPVVHKQGLDTMTWRQLIAIARPLKVKRYKSLTKSQLIEAIRTAKTSSMPMYAAPC